MNPDSDEALTPREREVLAAMADGERCKATAHRLNISFDTVRKHRASIFLKLGRRSAAGAVTEAIHRGLLRDGRPRPRPPPRH